VVIEGEGVEDVFDGDGGGCREDRGLEGCFQHEVRDKNKCGG